MLSGSPSTTSSFDHADMPPNAATAAPRMGVPPALLDLPHTPYSASGFAGWYGVPRESPSSAVHLLSPAAMYSAGAGGEEYIWFAQSPGERR